MSLGHASLTAALVVLGGQSAPGQEATSLESGQVFRGELSLEEAGSMCFTIELPIDVVVLDLILTCPLADLDLYANPGEHEDDLDFSAWSSYGEDGEEHIMACRLGDPPLEGGTIAVCVDYAYDYPPIIGSKVLTSTSFELETRFHATRVDAELTPGVPLAQTMRAEDGSFRIYTVEVPQGAPALRIDLFDAAGDLDLYARHRRRLLTHGPLLASERSSWGAETLLLVPDGVPRLRPGTWFIQVDNHVDPSVPLTFSIVASLGTEVPKLLQGLPRLGPPEGARGVARSLAGVFELFCGPHGGSGTCVSEQGLILTNAHVVDTGKRDEPVIVCAPLERGVPPRESFRGRVVELDHARDLALVQIVSGFWGEEIPADYRFPVVPRGDPATLMLGDPLFLAGYPAIGGQTSRVSLSLSRGIVSGFERSKHGLFIKTDAEIGGGSSGGAALDAEGRLMGVPSTTVEIGSGQFGFVQPVDAVPDKWRARLGW